MVSLLTELPITMTGGERLAWINVMQGVLQAMGLLGPQGVLQAMGLLGPQGVLQAMGLLGPQGVLQAMGLLGPPCLH